jgi:hypothetical protein
MPETVARIRAVVNPPYARPKDSRSTWDDVAAGLGGVVSVA